MTTEPGSLDGDLATFRERVRATLDRLAPPVGSVSVPVDMARNRALQAGLAAAGLAGIELAPEVGGAGLTAAHQQVFDDVAADYDLGDMPLEVSLALCVPTLLQWATPEQIAAHVPATLRAEMVWCQLFSEPDAGSDLAAVRTRATPVDDGWVLNGQKVWSSFAHEADRGLCIARTDPDVPKHAGLSAFIVDMRASGIETRPIRQITGGSHFNEVFLTDVVVGPGAMVGGSGDGWRVALTTLTFERVHMGARSREFVSGYAARAIAAARAAGQTRDPKVRQELAAIVCLETVLRLAATRVEHQIAAGLVGGSEGSVLKLGMARLAATSASVVAGLLGPASVAWVQGAEHGEAAAHWLLNSTMLSIAGGTTEVQRNITGERILGLPREPSVDRHLPFSAVMDASS